MEIDEAGNDRAFETLYLRNPNDQSYHRFTFTVDFFASAGEGRWWTDHRIPGGLAFTANSLGHMVKTREWFENKDQQEAWALTVAMRTIDAAQETPFGKATWLIDLDNGRSLKGLACPFKDTEDHVSKDWTAYEGLLHTDHSIRREFFAGEAEEPPLEGRPWLMDFTYIYDPSQADYKLFMGEDVVPEEVVYGEIGPPSEWRIRSRPRAPKGRVSVNPDIKKLLRVTESWPTAAIDED